MIFFRIVFQFLIIVAIFIGHKAYRLHVFQPVNCEEVIQISPDQYVEDIEFFIDFVDTSYPFAEAIRDEKGLKYFFDYKDEFLTRAREIEDNKDFIDLVAEMIQLLEQGTGHADIIWPTSNQSLPNITSFCTMYNIRKNSLQCQEYWCSLLDVCHKYVHSDLVVKYSNGKYVVDEDYDTDSCLIEKNTVIQKIDGQLVDDFVSDMQSKVWLRFDADLKKSYVHHPSPFLVCGSDLLTPWIVDFKTPDESFIQCRIPKLEGYRANEHLLNSDCTKEFFMLTKETGYVRVPFFPDCGCIDDDLLKLESLFKEKEIKKLIIDLRGNPGGVQKYGEELLIRPFIDESIDYTQYSAVKKPVYNKLKKCYNISRLTWRCDLNPGNIEKIQKDEVKYDIRHNDIDPNDYYFFKNTKTFHPSIDVDFNGEIYFLIDNDCFSSAEDLIRAVKHLNIGTLVGARSSGGAAAFFPPWYFELPNSHVMFKLEIEMAFNPDGTINEIYGTRPDFELETSTYPTPYPESSEQEDILKDPWVQWVLKN